MCGDVCPRELLLVHSINSTFIGANEKKNSNVLEIYRAGR